MPKLIILVGPPGSGKSTFVKDYEKEDFEIISQDEMGKKHIEEYQFSLVNGLDICIDRMNFNIQQRARYLNPAKEAGYSTEIIVLHENYETCLKRCLTRRGHPTIEFGDEKSAKSALQTFFTKYERPTPDEANVITFVYPEPKMKLNAIICDIDGTAANIDHRLHFVRKPLDLDIWSLPGTINLITRQKPDWKSFFDNIHLDTPNEWCREIVNTMSEKNIIVFCSGRPDSLRNTTQKWLDDNKFKNDWLFMRNMADHREDSIIKQILLDFEIKTRFTNIKFAIDDRARVVNMWRNNGIVTLACANGDF